MHFRTKSPLLQMGKRLLGFTSMQGHTHTTHESWVKIDEAIYHHYTYLTGQSLPVKSSHYYRTLMALSVPFLPMSKKNPWLPTTGIQAPVMNRDSKLYNILIHIGCM